MSASLTRADHQRVLAAFDTARAREQHVLRAWPEISFQQLHNRLQWDDEPLPSILERERDRRESTGSMWLRTLKPFRGARALATTLTGHAESVSRCRMSPDGTFLVSASLDGTLKIWDLHTGRERLTFAEHTEPVFGCAVDPDSSYVVSASADRTVKIWDAHDGHLRRTFSDNGDRVYACAVSPDGTFILSGGRDAKLTIWDPDHDTPTTRFTHPGPPGMISPVVACAISPDATFAVSTTAGIASNVKVWDTESWLELAPLEGHMDRVSGCAVSPCGTFIVTGGKDRTVRIWDKGDFRERAVLRGHRYEVFECAVTPDGRHIVSVGEDYTVKIWDVATEREIASLPGHSTFVNSCAVSPDGRWLASASRDMTINLWDLSRALESPDGEAAHGDLIGDCAFNPEGSRIATASNDHTLKIWTAPSGQYLATLTGHQNEVAGCHFSADGSLLSASGDHTVKRWDVTTASVTDSYEGHADSVWECAESLDGSLVVSVSKDTTVKLWERQSEREPKTLSGHEGDVEACAVSPDSSFVVSVGHDKKLFIWDATTGVRLHAFEGHTARVMDCAVSPDNQWIVSASFDRTLMIWDPSAEAEAVTLESEAGDLYGCAVTPDARYIVAAGRNALELWSVPDRVRVATLAVPGYAISVACHPALRIVACGDSPGDLHVIELVGIEYGPLVVTSIERQDELVLRCPACAQESLIEESSLGQDASCRVPTCQARLRINSFVALPPKLRPIPPEVEERLARRRDADRRCRELGDQAEALRDQKDLAGALAIHEDIEHLCREFDLGENLAVSLYNQATIREDQGDVAAAARLVNAAITVARTHGLGPLVEQLQPLLAELRKLMSRAPGR